jgi:hypothetical protein
MPSQARHGRFRTLVPHPSPRFHPGAPARSPCCLRHRPTLYSRVSSIAPVSATSLHARPGLALLLSYRGQIYKDTGPWGLGSVGTE